MSVRAQKMIFVIVVVLASLLGGLCILPFVMKP
jgi:hypothetical protein